MSNKSWDHMRQEERIEHLYLEIDRLKAKIKRQDDRGDNHRRSLDATFKALSKFRRDLDELRQKAGLSRRG